MFVIIVLDFKRCPFNWRTPLGYLVAFFGECAGITTLLITYTQLVNIVYESCWHFIIVARDLAKQVTLFNTDIPILNEEPIEQKKRFVEIVEYFLDAKK